jgi:hypothetical protein
VHSSTTRRDRHPAVEYRAFLGKLRQVEQHPEVAAGDPFVAAARARRAGIIAAGMASEECVRCGAVADTETDDGTALCEGCVL